MAHGSLFHSFKSLVETFGPMTVSEFQQSGKITPQEFVEAGDMLTQKFPIWKWMPGNPTLVPALPANKKYLMLTQAPSRSRPMALDGPGGETTTDDGWEGIASAPQSAADKPVAVLEDEPEGMQDDPEDDDRAPVAAAPVAAAAGSQFRTYDVTVTYDVYHATPRVFLFGYAADGRTPLTKEQMMDDVFAANRDKTVTVDPHPFTGQPAISIHPCRHAETMKRAIDSMGERIAEEQEAAGAAAGPKVPFVFPAYLCMFVFLKFVGSVIPTIEYDVSVGLEY